MQIPHLNINVASTSIHTALEKYLSFPISWEQNSLLLATGSAAKAAFPVLCKPVASFTQALVLFILDRTHFSPQSESGSRLTVLHPALRRLAECSILDEEVPFPALSVILILGVLFLVALSFAVRRLWRRKGSARVVVPGIRAPRSAHVDGDTLQNVSHRKCPSCSVGTQTEEEHLPFVQSTEKAPEGGMRSGNRFSFMTPPTTPDQCTSAPVLLGVHTPKKVTFANPDQPTSFVRSFPVVDTPTPLAGHNGSISRLPIRTALKIKALPASAQASLTSELGVLTPVVNRLATPPQTFDVDIDSPSPLSPRQRKRQRQMARNKARNNKTANQNPLV
ncbi:hypothetical protein CVT24_009098 [Panaeolus cyanescens]|uniref:Uncharacterized protein n=1 Tax=Panaeolus cyanescens TaxID=181874 RepID=A0A409VDJ1_9AGAR|nr:hypothetical protein CVT24_009098 [Panaeolus cyanescens]